VTLRSRLSLALVALTAVGLGVAALITYHQVGSYLVRRVDQELAAAARHPNIIFNDKKGVGGAFNSVPVGTYIEFRDVAGNYHRGAGGLTQLTPPVLPTGPIAGGRLFATHSPHYRVATITATQVFTGGELNPVQGTLIVAIPMRDIDDTLHRLLLIEILVAAGVLLALALLAWWVVQMGLKPLEEMSATAGAIAAGDLSRRVEVTDERSEVGQLGVALNSMLGQIEQAFAERTASEARLRRFVGDASHELRTPLTSIRGYAELFRRGAATRPDDLAKTMMRIEEAAARMGVLVEDLLLLARMDQGRPLELKRFDLSRLAAGAVDDLRAASPDRTVTFESNGPVELNGDELRLRQVVANLLENARTHTPPNTPVEVRVGIAGADAVIEVADQGPGMSADDAARVFERFWRADPSRARQSGGSGLGLAIVSAITEAHGGRAEVQTALGEGATFRIWLPLAGPPTNGTTNGSEPADADATADGGPAELAYASLPEVVDET
jgi:two-component system, OmpR family, sensor kinase